MRSLLEKAIVHLLNEDTDAATALFHQFMVERARQIHSSLREGEDFALAEGWDDELDQEEYFADDDLEDVVDDDSATEDGEESPISGDEGDDDTEALADDDMDGDTENVADRLDDIDDKLEKLFQEFEAMMGEDDIESEDEVSDTDDTEIEDNSMDDTSELDTDGDEVSDTDEDFSVEDEDEDEEKVAESDEIDEDDELDDITESVLSELEKVMVGDMQSDGEEVGNGKKITQNRTSSLPKSKTEATPKNLMSKQSSNDSFERETPPSSKNIKTKAGNNSASGKPSSLKAVNKSGDPKALLNKDFAGLKGNNKSAID